MDMNLSNTLLAGDPRLVDHIVGQVKSQGIFDQCRKECIADVDTKPAYQNLQNRVEGSVNSFLRSQTWKPDLNKNQLRETLRKHIHDAAFLEVGVERIVDQVVNPKIYSVFRPQIEDVVYKFLGLERPRQREKNGPCALKDLLPKDLDPISPESDRNSLKDESLESIDLNDQHLNGRGEMLSESKSQLANVEMKHVDDIKKEEITKIENVKVEELKRIDEIKVEVIERMEETEEIKNGQDLDENSMEFEKPLTKTASTSNLNISFRSDDKTEEEEESPQFEPIDIMNLNESNLSNDSHLSGISELTSHRSRSPDYSNEFSRDHFDLSNHDQDSQLSKVSSNSRLSIVTDFGSSNQASSHFPIANEDSKDKSRDNFRAIRDVEEGKYKESKFNFESIKSKASSQEKDSKSLKSFSSRENSRDEADSLREKSESKDGKDRNESFKSKIPKIKSESRDSKRHRDRDRDRKKQSSSSSSSRHSKSSANDRDQSREGSEKTKLKEEKTKEKEEKKVKDERKEKEDRKEKDEKKDSERRDSEKQEMVQDIFKDLKDIYKEKIRELREKKELTEKEKLNKDSKTKDSKEKRDSSRDKKDHKKDHRTSKSSDRHEKSSRKSNESKDKDKKRDDHRSSKDSKSRSSRSEKESRAKRDGKSEKSESRKDSKSESQSKEKKQREEKKKSKDDHSSLRKNSNDRRSTDRDGSNGSNSKSSQKTTSTEKSTTTLTKETNKTNSGGDTSDGIEDSQGNTSKLATTEFETQDPGSNSTSGEDIQLVWSENSSKTDNSNADTNALNEAVLPLKKRPFPEDSSSPSPTSSTEKVKKPKFAKNFNEAKKLMKIRRRMEKQNPDQDEVKVIKSEVQKLKVEESGKESLSNSPLPEEDITKVPDEERVQIIQVPDEECEEPYSEEINSLTLEETSMIILEGQILRESHKKESKLSLMERSIRQSLDEMMSDQKLAENAERNIERESLTNLREDASQKENVSSEKDVETVKEECILSENDKKDDIFSDKKSLEDEAEENLNLEKLEKVDEKLKDIPEEEIVEFPNQQGAKLESEEKIQPKNETSNETLSPKMELRVSMGIKQTTEDLMRNLLIEKLALSEKCSPEIRKESNKSPNNETVSENNLEVMKEDLSKSKEHIEDDEKYKEKDHRAISPVEEDCLYLEPDNERAKRFARFLESFEKKLNVDKDMKSFGENSHEKSEPKSMAPPQLKRKLSSSPLSDILLQNANNNNDGIKEGDTEAHHEKGEHGLKRRKLGRPKKQRPSLSSFNPPGLLNGENFVMPLSPESDVSASSEKTSGQPIKEEKSRTRNNQRYSSDDLYKPRPLFSSSSRRNRRSNQA
ncbi:myb-like protein X [Belonocnema kinseyi]|uniref:myb-like protein X n=1 Tax=Belonocnema kinseyi TaxID=2817044 RepID=UPI00143DBF1A|nr:myb-like protein X [Belonocnema kinseyi]